jgi:hypothetical protein
MPGPYFPNPSWPSFTYQGTTYDLKHLDEYEFTVVDTDETLRRIAVTFSDHCFTRNPLPGDDATLAYPGSNRGPGHFCVIRHQFSLGLVEHIAQAANKYVWTVAGENFAALPVVDQSGHRVLYGIMFSLERVTGLPVNLHMRVRTAYPIDDAVPVTYGSVRFRHLVALRMKGKSPRRVMDAHRKTPKLP